MTIELPPDAPPRLVEALQWLVQRWRDRFTGSDTFHLKDGEPRRVDPAPAGHAFGEKKNLTADIRSL